MGYKGLNGGRKKKSFRRPREIIEFTILGPNIDFVKKCSISLKLVSKCSIPTLSKPSKFQPSTYSKFWDMTWPIFRFSRKLSEFSDDDSSYMNAATELKFCGYTQGRYSVLWYQFESDWSIFYIIDFWPQNCKLDFLSRGSKGYFPFYPKSYLTYSEMICRIAQAWLIGRTSANSSGLLCC